MRFFQDGICACIDHCAWYDRMLTEFRGARQMSLFTVRNKMLAFHTTQLMETMDRTDLCTVKKMI